MKITIIGIGYVGLTTGMSMAYLGNEVVCIDIDQKKIDDLKNGKIPIYEPGLDELYELSKKNIKYTTSYEEAIKDVEIVFITVGTPANSDGTVNIKYISEASKMIGQNLTQDKVIIVNKSTVPIGSGNLVEALICDTYKEKNPTKGKVSVNIVSNPEFLKEGTAIDDTFYPDRIVLGSSSEYAIAKMTELYAPIIDRKFTPLPFLKEPKDNEKVPLVITDLVTAELIKYSANAFLSLKISFINEIASVSEKVGADILQIAKGIGLDKRVGSGFLKAGLGWGGSCFGKDTAALIAAAKEYNLDLDIIEASRKVNYSLRNKVIEKLQEELKIVKGKTVGLMGVAFKPNTDDLRDSPAIYIAGELIRRGAKVKIYDPIAMDRAKLELKDLALVYTNSCEELADESDALVLITEWPQFKEVDWRKLKDKVRNPLIYDGRNFLDKVSLEAIGFKVLGVGR